MEYLNTQKMPESECLVYAIRHVASGDCYIGSTTRPRHRLGYHLRHLSRGTHPSTALQKAWNTYGANAFVCEPMLVCDTPDRDCWEHALTVRMGGYNLRKKPGMYSNRTFKSGSSQAGARRKISKKTTERHAENRAKIYEPLCQKAWVLVLGGMYRKDACKVVGISNSTFANWIRDNGLKVRQF